MAGATTATILRTGRNRAPLLTCHSFQKSCDYLNLHGSARRVFYAGMFLLQNIARSFGAVHAVGPLDVEFEAGRTSVLIGPSGCGKSTLLRLMMGLVAPDDGTVQFEGTVLTSKNAMLLRRRMGYVIQDGGLFPHLTARRNITVMARYLKWDQDRIDRRVKELAALTRFPESALTRYPAQLSGGQRQRVSLMRALMLDPDVLLLDEPLGALDPMIRSELQDELRQIFRALNKTVVMVTHDLAEAGLFGDTILLMRSGDFVQKGTLAELVRTPADPFVSRFVNAQRGPLEVLGDEPA